MYISIYIYREKDESLIIFREKYTFREQGHFSTFRRFAKSKRTPISVTRCSYLHDPLITFREKYTFREKSLFAKSALIAKIVTFRLFDFS